MVDEDPGIDGPDYVSVVIAWDQPPEDAAGLVSETAAESDALEPPRPRPARGPALAAVLGVLAGLALTHWGLRRLRRPA